MSWRPRRWAWTPCGSRPSRSCSARPGPAWPAALYASRISVISPDLGRFLESVIIFCIVVLGGTGSIPGVFVGTAGMVILPELFRFVKDWRDGFVGLAMVLMMIFRPWACGRAGAWRWRWKRGSWSESYVMRGGIPYPVTWVCKCRNGIRNTKYACAPRNYHRTHTYALLEVTSLTKSFGGLMAVSNVDIRIEPGEILGMIGPNGAGKTTVFNLITGIYQPDKGTVVFDGKSLVGMRPHAIAAAGIARTFQTIRLFPP